MPWHRHNGGTKPIPDNVPFRPRIAMVTREQAQKHDFTTAHWEWQWKGREPGPGDIIEYETRD